MALLCIVIPIQKDNDSTILIPFTVVLGSVAIIEYIALKIVYSTYILMIKENSTINIEANIESNTSETTMSRKSYLRTLSLPTYEDVLAATCSEKQETPPPKYSEISFPA